MTTTFLRKTLPLLLTGAGLIGIAGSATAADIKLGAAIANATCG